MRYLDGHGMIRSMKFLVALISLSVALSFACSASRSATSPAPAPSPSITTDPGDTSVTNSTRQEKLPCMLTMSAAPAINGLKLGMTPEEVLALFPGSKDDPEVKADLARPTSRFGGSALLIRPQKFESKEKFSQISQIKFDFLDGRVMRFQVTYNGPEWPHVDKFVEKFVGDTNLPANDHWASYPGLDTQMKTLTCPDFEVRVFAGGEGGNLNYVLVQDLEADKELKERRRKAREQASPTPGQ